MNAATALEGLSPQDRAVVESALFLSRTVLEANPALLPSQLVGRLAGHPSPAIRALVERLRPQAQLCPAAASLERPGSPLRGEFEVHSDFVGGLIFLADGRIVSSSEDSKLVIIDSSNGQILTEVEHDMPVNALAISPSGKRIAGACDDGKIYVYDLAGKRVREIEAHDEYVRRVAFTKGRLVSTSNDNTVKVWDRDSGKLLKKFQWKQTTQGLAVSPGGRYVLVCSVDNVMKILDVNTLKFVKTLTNFGDNFIGDVGGFGFINADNDSGVGHEDYCKDACWTPDGSKILSVEKELITWDAKTGKQLERVKEWAWGWDSLAITADGRYVLLAGRQIEIREVAAPGNHVGRIATLQGFDKEAKSIALSPDGSRFATGHDDGKVRVWDLQAALGAGIASGHSENISVCDFSRDGRTGITAAGDGQVKLWDLATGAETRTLSGHLDPFVEAIAVLPDGRRLVTTDHSGTLFVWDMTTGEKLVTGKMPEEKLFSFRQVVPIENATKAIAGQVLEGLTIWDLEKSGEAVMLEGEAYGTYGLTLTTDQRLAYTSGYADDERVGGIGIWDVPARKRIGFIANSSNAKGKYFDSFQLLPGERTAVTADNEGRIEVWDLDSKKRIHELQGVTDGGGWLPQLTVLPGGRLLSAQHFPGDDETRIEQWDVESGTRRVLVRQPGKYRDVKAHAATKRVMIAGDDLRLYDLENGALLAAFQGDAAISHVAMTPDGKTILAGEINGRVHVLRVQV